MAGLRKMVYTPSQEVWDRIKAAAEAENRTMSNFLISLFFKYESERGAPVLAKRQSIPEAFDELAEAVGDDFNAGAAIEGRSIEEEEDIKNLEPEDKAETVDRLKGQIGKMTGKPFIPNLKKDGK